MDSSFHNSCLLKEEREKDIQTTTTNHCILLSLKGNQNDKKENLNEISYLRHRFRSALAGVRQIRQKVGTEGSISTGGPYSPLGVLACAVRVWKAGGEKGECNQLFDASLFTYVGASPRSWMRRHIAWVQ